MLMLLLFFFTTIELLMMKKKLNLMNKTFTLFTLMCGFFSWWWKEKGKWLWDCLGFDLNKWQDVKFCCQSLTWLSFGLINQQRKNVIRKISWTWPIGNVFLTSILGLQLNESFTQHYKVFTIFQKTSNVFLNENKSKMTHFTCNFYSSLKRRNKFFSHQTASKLMNIEKHKRYL